MLDRKPYTIEHITPLAETNSKRAKKLTIRSAHELRRREFPALRYVVPGYIAEGCTILAGRPKLGKSWLVLDMGLAVATVERPPMSGPGRMLVQGWAGRHG
jgi:hypothetical protein